jgi:hypothetical protein
MSRNHNLFPSLDAIQKRAQLVLGLEGSKFRHIEFGHAHSKPTSLS